MARTLYGASPADYFIDAGGTPNRDATASVWTSRTGGVQLTDLQSVTGTTIAVVVADNYGGFRFFGPDNYRTTLWIEGAIPGLRYKADPVDVADRVAGIEAAAVRSVNGIFPGLAGDVSIAVGTDGGGGSTAVTGTTAGTVAAGDDARITGAVQKTTDGTDFTRPLDVVRNLGVTAELAKKAPLISPTFSGTPVLPAGTQGLTKATVGLPLVGNIAPDQMPVSVPQAAAIAAAKPRVFNDKNEITLAVANGSLTGPALVLVRKRVV